MKKIWIGAALTCALALAGCGSGSKTGASQPVAGTELPDEINGGTVTGKVVFEGTPPAAKTIDMSANPACMEMHSAAPVKSEEVIVNGNGTLKNAFVWIKAGLPEDKKWKVPAAPVELDQSGCMYQPHVIGVMAGQNVALKNSDSTNHNIHPTTQSNAEWNESQPPHSDVKLQSFAHPEIMIPIKCNIHPWMRSYVGVVAHPFFAVTGDDGTFTIKGLPPGTYTVETWHEKYGTRDQQVTVGARESKTVDFSFKG